MLLQVECVLLSVCLSVYITDIPLLRLYWQSLSLI